MDKPAICGGTPVRSKPFPTWPQSGSGERRWLEKVLAKGQWFAGTRGDDPEALGTLFGERFAALHGARYGLPVSNGSVAIEIALRSIGIRPGDEVIVPSYTFVSTATSVLMVGGIPVFADMDPQSYCLDPRDVNRRIGVNTRAVIPVHLGGHMADMSAFEDLAKAKGLALVEDSAQAIDAAWKGRKAGTWGDLGTYSFQANKTITSGEGGLVMTNNPGLAERAEAFRAFGRARGPGAERSSDLGSKWLSSNYRLSEFQAAVLLAQLERFPVQDARRQTNASRLSSGIHEIPGVRHVRVDHPEMKHGYYYYLIRYEPEQFGDLEPVELSKALQAEGIPFVPGDRKPIYRHPVFEIQNLAEFLSPQILEKYREAVDLDHPQCPATEEACGCTLILRHQVLLGEPRDVDDIVEALWKVRKNINALRLRRSHAV
jgi:dTDP-4-amino-4,6-dideoxygalactose transaminase